MTLFLPEKLLTPARSTDSLREGVDGKSVIDLDTLAPALDEKISDMEHCIEEKIDHSWNNIQGNLDRILAIIDMLAFNINNKILAF